MILVTGATGHVGSELLQALAESGEEVRGLTRSARPPAWPNGVQAATGDLDHPDSLTPALKGVGGVFLLPGYADMTGLMSAIRAAGVERVVLLSGSSAENGDSTNAITEYMMRSEVAVQQSGLSWTFLRSHGFFSNSLEWAETLRSGDVITAPFADVAITAIDPFDIAAVAVKALTTPGHEGAVYRISGPEPIRPADRVRILAEVLGRSLSFKAESNDEARARMTAEMPQKYVDAFFSFYVDGTLDESAVMPTVEQLLGRPPRPFKQWATAHAATFQ
jgi:uncharacterized protein YbjT (DUF2867 family)